MATTYSHPSSTWRKNLPRFWQYLILSLFVLLIFMPIVIAIFGALKTRGEMYSRPYTPPIPPHWENYARILSQESFWIMLRNSLLVMLGRQQVWCSLAAWPPLCLPGWNSGARVWLSICLP